MRETYNMHTSFCILDNLDIKNDLDAAKNSYKAIDESTYCIIENIKLNFLVWASNIDKQMNYVIMVSAFND